jgi:hypothetical protein
MHPPHVEIAGMMKTDDKCCTLSPVYKCLPCQYHCDNGYYPRLLARGTGIPSHCCHQYYCQKGMYLCIVTNKRNNRARYYYIMVIN